MLLDGSYQKINARDALIRVGDLGRPLINA